MISKPLSVPRGLLAQAAMRLLPDIFQVPGSSKKSFGRPSQRTDHGNTAWPRVLTGLGHHASRPSHLTSQGPSVFGNRTHRLAGHPLPRPGLVAHHGAGSCVWPAECVPGALEPPTVSLGATNPLQGAWKPLGSQTRSSLASWPREGHSRAGRPCSARVTGHGVHHPAGCAEQRPSPGNRPQFIQYLDLLKY